MDPFDRFGPAHWLTVAAVAGLAFIASRAARTSHLDRIVRTALSLLLGATALGVLLYESGRGALSLTDILPLHLSDFAVLLAIFALLTRRPRAAELLYFLSFVELLAILTPDVRHALPHPRTLTFFALHGGTIVAAAVLTFGTRLVPQRGAVVRALVFLNGYAAFAALVNALLGTNFLYLRAKPREPSPLDWMGPWPWYLVTAEAVAIVLFSLAYLPFRRRSAA